MVRYITFLIITVFLVAGVVEGEEKTDPVKRIAGGSEAYEGEFPYQISLRREVYQDEFRFLCGGSIISHLWVLTSAQCTEGLIKKQDDVVVVVGTNERRNHGDKYKVDKIIPHEGYNKTSFENDIALIKLAEEIKYGPNVGNIALPISNTPDGVDLIVSGWGSDRNGGAQYAYLQKLKVKSLSMEECQNSNSKAYIKRYPITENQLCTYASDSFRQGICGGDNGSPLAYDAEIVGVASWSFCANGKPDVFTRVFAYLDWIKKNTGLE